MKEFKQLGAYGLLIKDNSILLIKKNGGPYDGKLDLPGGTIEFGETPQKALVRELKEEVGIDVLEYELYDANSVFFEWKFKDDMFIKVHHVGVFFKINNFKNKIKKKITTDDKNDDSLGANYYKISSLKKSNLSKIAILELEKLGYKLD